MKEIIHKHITVERVPLILGIGGFILVIILLGLGAGTFFLAKNIIALKNETASSTKILNTKIANLEAVLATTTLTSTELAQRLADQQNKSEEFASTIDDIAGTVGTLEKLSKTDKELLQKYSKVYFLSDNYVPMRLEDISSDYLNDQAKKMQFHSLALPFLERLLDRAADDGVDLKIVSAYRSFGTQSILKASYSQIYGSGANQFSADQGYSEHQLGTTLDLTTPEITDVLAIKFETTPAYAWLNKYAYKYGFVLSYPKNNSYYQYEPWHWRFVGVKLATKLHRDGLNFSDLDQREIDNYLVNIFD